MRISIQKHGVKLLCNRLIPSKKPQNHTLRGKVVGFSTKSNRRFRDLLISAYVPGKNYIAISLTIPEKITSGEWFSLLKRFRMQLLRKNKPAIWRVELQKRKVPHLHLIGFGNNILDVGDYWLSWVNSVDSLQNSDGVPFSVHKGFLIYGFVAKFVRSENWFKYLACHSSKHKTTQLGWEGRQWGVIGRDMISFTSDSDFELDDFLAVRLCRCIRRMTRYNVTKDNLGSYLVFCSPCLVRRIITFYSDLLPF